MLSQGIQERINRIGTGVLRWSLVLFFVGWGFYKFTPQEAAGIAPLTAHSPFLFWVNPLLGERGGSALIGIVEISLGTLVALRHVRPLWSAYGSLGVAAALVVTLSFLFTTPGLNPESSDAGFLAKDLTLLGAALATAAEALSAARTAAGGKRLQTVAPSPGVG